MACNACVVSSIDVIEIIFSDIRHASKYGHDNRFVTYEEFLERSMKDIVCLLNKKCAECPIEEVERTIKIMNKKCDECSYVENKLIEELSDALAKLLDSPRWIDQATVPKEGIDYAPRQVFFNTNATYFTIKKAEEALKEADNFRGIVREDEEHY